ncbi:SAM-dependent methyltransferase [Leptolyngbya sp. FACHB-711]|uniref:SAM-dependent methyltransferase n=1 Tax=Leptolyngbya sp. FACHB-711 TaxID=2692813 RepID=UPI001F54DEB9|nr:SAM-dependent methyltransferase [Leptolyngbya sp. FACHB-711]
MQEALLNVTGLNATELKEGMDSIASSKSSISSTSFSEPATNSSTKLLSKELKSDLQTYSPNKVFFCPEESHFYAQCLEKMLLNQGTESITAVEFGAGDGSPVIHSLLKAPFAGEIHGFELNSAACELAQARIKQYQLHDKYFVHNHCFFEGLKSKNPQYLIANPPYIPAPDDDICMPALHGGVDGATITKKLLSVDCENVILMISAYSNPIDTIEHAIDQGYQVSDFMVTPLQFGYYSSEPKVRNWISEMQRQRKAFYSANIYFLAGVLFQKKRHAGIDLSAELLQVMTAL